MNAQAALAGPSINRINPLRLPRRSRLLLATAATVTAFGFLAPGLAHATGPGSGGTPCTVNVMWIDPAAHVGECPVVSDPER